MRHRIRAAALLVSDGRMLLVQHVHPEMLASTFWHDREKGFPGVHYLGRHSD